MNTLKIIIGDDALNVAMIEERVTQLVEEISKFRGKPCLRLESRILGQVANLKDYVPDIHKYITQFAQHGTYWCEPSPIEGYDALEFRCVSSIEALVQEAKIAEPPYNWIITDLDYGLGEDIGGLAVIEDLHQTGGIKVLFTSESTPFIGRKGIGGINYLNECSTRHSFRVIIANKHEDKWDLLAKTISSHYSKEEIR